MSATEIFNVLPEDGSSITGKQLRELLPDLGRDAIDAGKAELKADKRIVVGRGRGGKLARAEGAEAPVEERKLTKEEALEIAREEKAQKTKAQRELDEAKAAAKAAGERRNPDADRIVPLMYDRTWYVEVWTMAGDGSESATTDFIPEEELL